VSGSGDMAIRLWDVAREVETGSLNGHQSAVLALAVLPGGRLASASRDKTIRVWNVGPDADSGHEIARIEVDASVLCLTALSDHRIVAGDSLGRLHWLDILE